MIAFATAGPEPMVPASPQPLAPMGLTGVGVTVRSVSMLGTMERLGHGVIHEAAGEQLAILIVDHLFVERLRQPLGHAPMYLAIDDERINDIAAVVHGHKTVLCHIRRCQVDLDNTDVRAEGESGIAGLKATRGLQARFEIRRHTTHGRPVKIRGRKGDFGKGLLAVGVSR